MTGQTKRKGALLDSGTPSPNPWDLSLSRQNVCSTMKALERRIGLRRDATRAPIQGPEWQGAGFHSRPQNSTPRPRRALAYCRQKMVLTMGSTLMGRKNRKHSAPSRWSGPSRTRHKETDQSLPELAPVRHDSRQEE